jgi:hypothetical protein
MDSDPDLYNLVRSKFNGVPNETFEDIPLERWIDMLSFEDQITLAEQLSEKKQENGTMVTQKDVNVISDAHKQIPIDVWAVMLKNSKNSTLRALCRVDVFFRSNCFSIIKKIGTYRHGNDFSEQMQYRGSSEDRLYHKQHPVEYLIAWEIRKVAKKTLEDRKTTSRFFFKNYKEKLELELYVSISPDSYAVLYPRNDKTIIYLISETPFGQLSGSEHAWFFTSIPKLNNLMQLMVKENFDLWKVEADEIFETPSKKDGKPFTYQGMRKRKDVVRMTKCITCRIEPAVYHFKGIGNNTPLYCSDNCATIDWELQK